MAFLSNLLLSGVLWAAGSTATPFDAVVSSPTLWSMVGTNGEVRELWTGPREGALTEPKVLRLAGYAEVRQGGAWIDLRTLAYERRGSRPGRLVLATADGAVRIRVTARRARPSGPIFLRYTFDRARDVRFRVDLREPVPASAVRHEDRRGATTVGTRSIGPLTIATLPAGRHLGGPEPGRRLVREITGAPEVTVCLHAGPGGVTPRGDETFAAAWLRALAGPEDTEAERARDRIRIHTGLEDLDRLLAASIDAVEANRFASGVVIAGADGWYKNTWIRDGTYAMIGHDLAGFHEASDAFYRFWVREGGFSFGGENEAQQPAIGIMGMAFHARLRLAGDRFLAEVFPYVRRYAAYYAQRVEREGMLHTAEEWICQVPSRTAWPNAEVHAGLVAASRIAERLGRRDDAVRWTRAARTLREAILETAYDAGLRRFIPLAGPAGAVFRHPEHPDRHHLNGPMRDARVDSGMLMLARLEIFGRGLGAVEVDDPRFAATQAWIHRVLEQPDHAISRFDANLASPHYPTGQWPVWPISAAWAADVEWLRGRSDRAWRYIIAGVVRKAGYDPERAMYTLPEQWTLDGRPVRTTRFLTWSHGELLTSAILLLLGLEVDVPGADLALSPSLPPGTTRATVRNFRFRGWSLDLEIARGSDRAQAALTARRRPGEGRPDRLRASLSGRIVGLSDGDEVTFPGRPLGPRAAPLRAGDALERARLFDRILLDRDLPGELADASVERLEAHIRQVEDRFDRERLRTERARRQAEIRAATLRKG